MTVHDSFKNCEIWIKIEKDEKLTFSAMENLIKIVVSIFTR